MTTNPTDRKFNRLRLFFTSAWWRIFGLICVSSVLICGLPGCGFFRGVKQFNSGYVAERPKSAVERAEATGP